MSKELALHYETVVYDYDRLSSIYVGAAISSCALSMNCVLFI